MNINLLKTASHRNLVSLNGVLSCIAIVFSSFVFASIASAANYYVDTTGSNSYTATEAQNWATPWQTIQKAANNVSAGDTVHVAPGTYSYTSTDYAAILTTVSGTASSRIRYVSDTKWGAKIVSKGTWAVWRNDGDYVDIEGFDITGDGAGGIYNFGSFNRIIGNHVHNISGHPNCATDPNGGAGIDNANYSASDDDIIGNVVHDVGIVNCGTGGGVGANNVHGIYHANLRGHILNNIVYNNSGYGINNWHASKDVVISNNLAFGNGSSGIIIGDGDSPGGTVADNFVVNNNISINNAEFGIIEYKYSSDNTIGNNNYYKNNVVYGNGSGGIHLIVTGHDTSTITTE